ncbi:hypothetical protein COK01_09175 [Priestia megaterium]|nr:hypothetical protein [Priestia megaterium]MDH6653237.1 hypothetical protein [Bacillus sp. PvP124]MDP9576662.1 hypothetical protein [Bacillus sp. 1751]MDP9721730.1 hypothetical protein [Priestia aryabhattai]RFB26097.1 hypothetical protein DZB87_18475 [Bacillus sp. ALD]
MAGDKIQTNYFSVGQDRLDFYILGITLFAFVFQQHVPDETQPKSKQLPRRNRANLKKYLS